MDPLCTLDVAGDTGLGVVRDELVAEALGGQGKVKLFGFGASAAELGVMPCDGRVLVEPLPAAVLWLAANRLSKSIL